ncbi:uncharacterized protein RAG0_02821 [Rhynchosporium agropyri]|uniref:Uncharacterized protein n=1 Tax=Rhynchosporium agropyri TaxID=914238 RepID=A0A1E1K321_9HELO|nr:uncharacterized protein RAG0_02821 [Rhynchosporium agropyri]
MAVFGFQDLAILALSYITLSTSYVLDTRVINTKMLLTIPGSSSGYEICQPSTSAGLDQSRCTLTWVAHSNLKDSARIFIFDSDCKTINAPTTVTSAELNAKYAATSELRYTIDLYTFDSLRPKDSLFWYGADRYIAAFQPSEKPGTYNEYIELSGNDPHTNGEGTYHISRNQFLC